MRKYIFTLLLLLVSVISFAQQASEIDPKFIKLPRYANLSAINTAITTPTQGMMVYNIATATNWYYNGANWFDMSTAGSGIFANTDPNSISPVLQVTTNGVGGAAGIFNSTNTSNPNTALYVSTKGTGGAFNSVVDGTGGRAGIFQITNASNAANALHATTDGTGKAAYFQGTNALETNGAIKFGGSGVGTIAAGKVLTATDALGNATWQAPALILPYSQTASNAHQLIEIINTYNVPVSSGRHTSLRGEFTGNISGIPFFDSPGYGAGIVGEFSGAGAIVDYRSSGVYGLGRNRASGVLGESNGHSGSVGVYGISDIGYGIFGYSTSGNAGSFSSTSGNGGSFSSVTGYALITGAGNVGIGTATPTAKLEVAGQAKINNGSNISVDASNSSSINPTIKVVNSTNLAPAIDITGGIKVSGTNKAAFKVVTSATYIAGNKFGILNTTMANVATDILIVTYEYTGGSYLNKQFATFWNGGNWEIHLTDGTAMPIGITFNILVIKQ